MKLLTKPIIEQATKQYKLGADMNQMVVAKFFNPAGRGTWYLMNMSDNKGTYCWGIAHIFEHETGSFSIPELIDLDLPFGLKIERDRYFKPIKASALWDKLTKTTKE